MSILDDIKADINEAFLDDPDSPFRPGTLIQVPANLPFTANPVVPGPQGCRAFRDEFSAKERNDWGVPDENVKILMLQTNDTRQELNVRPGDQITLEDLSSYGVVRVLARDPASATFTLEGVPQ